MKFKVCKNTKPLIIGAYWMSKHSDEIPAQFVLALVWYSLVFMRVKR